MLNVKLKSSLSLNQTDSLSAHRNSMTDGHHIYLNACSPNILAILGTSVADRQIPTANSGCYVKLSKPKYRIVVCQTCCNYLLAPTVKSISITSRNTEQIQTSDRYLTEHYAASFYICEYNFYGAVHK